MKKIKDPLYGYIEISDKNVLNILDSPEFHRLQDIVQTSYMSVFPTAVNTRFTHSLGVYYLGKIACVALVRDMRQNYNEEKDIDIDKWSRIFQTSCLLHDVGHAPFSHTGEDFYRTNRDSTWVKLIAILNDSEFSDDSEKKAVGNPHEIMSALFAITYFADAIGEDKSFFARCIIGLKYKTQSLQNDIKNCFIELLNSKTIDVDKLDYLLRDGYTTGFCTVKIDYMRLLNAVCVCEEKGRLYIAFDKSALSVLESVVMARDFDRSKRMKPLWKSESEYRILFERKLAREPLDALARLFDRITDELLTDKLPPVICSDTLKYYKGKVGNKMAGKTDDYKNVTGLMELLEGIADNKGNPMVEFKFAVITGTQFDTGFNSDVFKDIRVRFQNFGTTKRLGEVINLLNANKPNDNFFYVYCHCKENGRYALAEKVRTELAAYAVRL